MHEGVHQSLSNHGDESVPLKYLIAPLFRRPESGYLRPTSSRAAQVAIDPVRARAARSTRSASGRREPSLPMSHFDPIEMQRAERRVRLEKERLEEENRQRRLAQDRKKRFLQVFAQSAPKTDEVFGRLSTSDTRNDTGWNGKLHEYRAPLARNRERPPLPKESLTDQAQYDHETYFSHSETSSIQPQIETDDFYYKATDSLDKNNSQASAFARARQEYTKRCADQIRDYTNTTHRQRQNESLQAEQQRQDSRNYKARIRARRKHLAKLATLADQRFHNDVHAKALLVRNHDDNNITDARHGVKIRRARNKFGTVYHTYLKVSKGREPTPICEIASLPPVLLGPGPDPDRPFLRQVRTQDAHKNQNDDDDPLKHHTDAIIRIPDTL